MDLDKLQVLGANVGALLQSRGTELLKQLKTGAELLAFRPQVLSVGGLRLITTSLIAEGGYSFVYTARELMPGTEQGRLFALKKIIAQDAETLEIARAEQNLLATLPPHPHIVRYFGGSIEQRRLGGQEVYMVLEYCPHGSLVDLVLPSAPVLSEARLLSIFHSVCKAVAHLHSQQPPIAHRDLKLENVLCNASGLFKLCDFGSVTTRRVRPESRAERLREEEVISKCSTLMYRAPEMVNLYLGHEISEAVDVWALGCILYTLAFRRHPFDAGTELQIVNAAVTMPRDSPFSADVHALITYALEPDPQKRPTVFELIARVVARRARVLDDEIGVGGDEGAEQRGSPRGTDSRASGVRSGGSGQGDGFRADFAQPPPPPNWGAPRELAQSQAPQLWDAFADGGGVSPARGVGAAQGAPDAASGCPDAASSSSSSSSSLAAGRFDGASPGASASLAPQLAAFGAVEPGRGSTPQPPPVDPFATAASAQLAHDASPSLVTVTQASPAVTSRRASLSLLPTAPLLAPPPGAPPPVSSEGPAAVGAHGDLLAVSAPSLAQPSSSELFQQAPSVGLDEALQFGAFVVSPESQALFPPPPPVPVLTSEMNQNPRAGFNVGSGVGATPVGDLI